MVPLCSEESKELSLSMRVLRALTLVTPFLCVSLLVLFVAGMIYHLSQRVVEERDAVVEYERLVAEHAPSWSFFIFGTGWSSGSREASRLPPRPVEHIVPPFPCCYRVQRPTTVAAAWLYQCQLMAVQFVILRPVLTIVPLVLKHTGVVDLTAAPVLLDGYNINWYAPNLYILFVTNVSVAVAFYGLLSFYHGTEKDLEWCDPWPKFLCIKGVVFCTFWQSLTIQFLSGAGRMDDHSALQIQNLLICIEMFLAAIAHFYVFPHDEWKDGYKREKEKGIMLRDTLALRDFVKDMALMVTSWNTESEMEVLSEEKAKLTSELMNLASMSHTHRAGSGSRRGSSSHHASPEHSPPAPGHSGSKYGASAVGLPGSGSHRQRDRDRDRDRDLENTGGIGFQSSILNFPSFSFDLAGAEHLHRSEAHSVTMSAYGGSGAGTGGGGGGPHLPHPPTERTRLVSYHAQQLAVRGMRRQGKDPHNLEWFPCYSKGFIVLIQCRITHQRGLPATGPYRAGVAHTPGPVLVGLGVGLPCAPAAATATIALRASATRC